MKFHELCKTEKFKSTPSIYFGPLELDKDKGDYPFLIQFIDEGEYPKRIKNKKTYWSTVIDLLEDRRTDRATNPISPGRYRFDLAEEYMAALDRLSVQGVNIFAAPMEFIHRRRYKGKHLFSFYDFHPVQKDNRSVPSVPTEPDTEAFTEKVIQVEPKPTVKPPPNEDDFNFDFDE